MEDEDNVYYPRPLDFWIIIQCLLLILKLTGVIGWSWWVVLLPAIVPAAVIIIAILFILLAVINGAKKL